MMRKAVFLLVPVAAAGFGALVLHRNGTLLPAALFSPAAAQPSGVPGPALPTVVGMNVAGLQYFSGEWAFNDLVVNSAHVSYADPKGGWKDPEGYISLDANGYPINVPEGTTLPIILLGGPIPLRSGTYACSVSDGWTPSAMGDWTMNGLGKRITMVVKQGPAKGGVVLQLTANRKNASLSSLSCRADGAEASGLFNPAFLAETKPYKVLRFMDWMRTNNLPRQTWATRSTPASLTQGGAKGVAVEYMVELANRQGADPWFTMPLDADAEYYANFAAYVRDHLDLKLKAYVEFSNEVWNDAFGQSKLATQRGQKLYPNVDAITANDYYYADRVRDLMAVWSTVFAGQEKRLVRVLANQAAWADRADRALSHKDTWKSVDVLAIAPYFWTDPYTLPGTGAVRVDATFKRAPQIVNDAIGSALHAKKVANKYKLPLVAYEGGPSFVGYQKEIADDMLAVNRDPRMYDLYRTFLQRWQTEVGGLLVLYASAAAPGPGGQFGHQEYTGQPLSEAPKARAVRDFIAQPEK